MAVVGNNGRFHRLQHTKMIPSQSTIVMLFRQRLRHIKGNQVTFNGVSLHGIQNNHGQLLFIANLKRSRTRLKTEIGGLSA
jgi:hypothetical protein